MSESRFWALLKLRLKKTNKQIKDRKDEIATGSWGTISHVVFTGWLVSCWLILSSMHTCGAVNDTLITTAARWYNAVTYHLFVNNWLNLIDQARRCWFVCLYTVVFTSQGVPSRKPSPRPLTPLVFSLLFPKHLAAGEYCPFSVPSLIGTQLIFIASMMSSQLSRNLVLKQVGL